MLYMKQTIAAGIVLFNPEDKARLEESINSVLFKVSKVYIFDNSTEEIVFTFPRNAVYLTEHDNKGIAYALNRIMEVADSDGFKWVVTMDQDSILPDGIIEAYLSAIELHDNIGIICPQVIDTRRAYMIPKKDPKEEFIDECITSASCTSVDIWDKLGKFDEWLFVDLVDNEFCKRLVCSGYKILRLNNLILNQEFGKIIPKSPRKQHFWIKLSKLLHNDNIAKFSYNKYVSFMRVYYTNRNIIYVNRKMKNYGPTAYANYNCKGYLGFLTSFCLPSLLRAQKKGMVLKAIVIGIRDGRKKKVEPWSC